MASSAVNVPNPVTNPTSVQLAQIAANISNGIFVFAQKGDYMDIYDLLGDLAQAVNCVAQSMLCATVASGTSSVGTVTTRGAYALGPNATIPTFIGTSPN